MISTSFDFFSGRCLKRGRGVWSCNAVRLRKKERKRGRERGEGRGENAKERVCVMLRKNRGERESNRGKGSERERGKKSKCEREEKKGKEVRKWVRGEREYKWEREREREKGSEKEREGERRIRVKKVSEGEKSWERGKRGNKKGREEGEREIKWERGKGREKERAREGACCVSGCGRVKSCKPNQNITSQPVLRSDESEKDRVFYDPPFLVCLNWFITCHKMWFKQVRKKSLYHFILKNVFFGANIIVGTFVDQGFMHLYMNKHEFYKYCVNLSRSNSTFFSNFIYHRGSR